MSTFTPTHRTNRAIGKIKACSPIRVAQYTEAGFFSDLLEQLGVKDDSVDYYYQYGGEDVKFWDSRVQGSTTRNVLPGDYVITDGENFEVSNTDNGWDDLPARKVSGTGEVYISFHETYYCLYGAETELALRLTPAQLRNLAARIEGVLPEVSPIEDARFITGFHQTEGAYYILAKFDDAWYDDNGNEYTEQQVLDNYDEIEVIR